MKRSLIRSAKHVALGLLLVSTLVSVAEAGNRKFYLAKDGFNGSQALTACAKGYHMASLWEIHEPSTLTYNTKLGFTQDDSGSGPPTNVLGWIRTGYVDSVLSTAGAGNCHTWTSSDGADQGAFVGLQLPWGLSSSNVSPWAVTTAACNAVVPVWCVSGK